MGVVPGKGVQGGSRSAGIVNQLVEELHEVLSGKDGEAEPAVPSGARRKRVTATNCAAAPGLLTPAEEVLATGFAELAGQVKGWR